MYRSSQVNTSPIKMLIEKAASFDAIIFDLDGTLADTMPLHYRACQEVCNPKGFDFPVDFFLSEAGRPTTDVFVDLIKKLDLKVDAIELAEEKENRFLEILPEVKFIPEIQEIFSTFKGSKKLAIGSGGRRTSVVKTLQALGIEDDFDAIVSANEVLKHKPYPDTFIKCANLMEIAPEKCIVFEDGDPGIKAAFAANMSVIDIRKHTKIPFLG